MQLSQKNKFNFKNIMIMIKISIFLVGVIILLAITNPTIKDLKEEFIPEFDVKNTELIRKRNFLICSTYEYHYYTFEEIDYYLYRKEHYKRTYFGILKNFFVSYDIWVESCKDRKIKIE